MADGGPWGDPELSRALVIGKFCEQFNCTPLVARRELDEDPDQLGLLIIDIRGYLAAKRLFDNTENKARDLRACLDDPYMTLVQEFTLESRDAAFRAASGGDGR